MKKEKREPARRRREDAQHEIQKKHNAGNQKRRPQGEFDNPAKGRPVSTKAGGKRKGKRQKKKKGILSTIILLIALAVFVVSGVQVVRLILPYFQGGAEYDDIKELVIENKSGDGEDIHLKVDFERLKEINPDTVAWVRFDQPEIISYPVVQTTNNSTYLSKTFQANDNKLGAIFMDCDNSPDFSDKNTFIYGHNLKVGGEMFSGLKEYASAEFYKKNPYFYIYTPDNKARTYQIFSAGVVKETADNYRKIYNTDEEYAAYLQLAKSSSAYDTGVEVTTDSWIVSLSTCTNDRADERFLVQGVLIEEITLSAEE